MYCVSLRASRGLRWSLLGLAAIVTFTALSQDAAEAKWRRKKSESQPPITAGSRYAAIVVDGNTGNTLHSANPDSIRHPASLTKIMTLYLLFERLESGKLALNTPLEVSAHAASQAPSKLGLKPGQSIEVEDAIKALVTKSANDVAVVIAEALGGSEDEFAKLMTRKARALGMSRTVYKNASGLPDNDQVTTARDQALLGLAIQDRFPRYYRYFSTSSFQFRGRSIRNHNNLLGRVDGIDGIKTGYIRASGFNLVSSLHRNNRYLVAVVLGGATGAQRDARMRDLLEQYIVEASVKRTAPKIAEVVEPSARARARAASSPPVQAIPLPTPRAEVIAASSAARGDTTTATIPQVQPGSTDPIRPLLVKTLVVKPGAMQVASNTGSPRSELLTLPPSREADALPPPPGAKPGILGVLPMRPVPAAAELDPAPTVPLAAQAVAAPNPAPVETASPAPAQQPAKVAHSRGGWLIQVGAFPDEGEARQRLNAAQSKISRLLAEADPFTEPVVKGEKTLYRARFAGLEKDRAQAACRALKKNDIACMALKNE